MASSPETVTVQNTQRCSCCPHWSYFLLVAVILGVSVAVSLVLLPFILFDPNPVLGTDPLACTPAPYTGTLCLRELRYWQSCLPERLNTSTTEVLVPASTDQELAEHQASVLFSGLQLARTLVMPSQDCEKEFREFWCLLLFGVCDDSGRTRLPSFELCDSLQTETCYNLIQFAASVPEFSVVVQNCNNFRIGDPPPCRNESAVDEKQEFNVTCSDGFFYDEGSLLCLPKCGKWSPLSPNVHTTLSIALIIGNVASVIICTTVLVISFIQYKQIFTFPSVLIIYSTLTVLVVTLLDFVSFLPFDSLLCTSKDLLNDLRGGEYATGLCTFQGALFLYAVLVISLFWLFQSAVYFWVVIHPINFRSFNTSGKIQTIHLLSVIVSLSLPAVPPLAIYFGKGYALSSFVPHKCIPQDLDLYFYIFSVPFIAIIIGGISLLVSTMWHIGNVMGRVQRKPNPRDGKLKTAEIKFILLIIIYTCVAIHSNLSTNITLSHVENHIQALEEYLTCESFGDPGMTCPRDGLARIEMDAFAQTSVYVVFSLYPSIFFIFLLSPRMCLKLRHKKTATIPPVTSSTAISSQAI